MVEAVGYRGRLQVRLGKALHTEDVSRVMKLAGRDVVIVSQAPNQPLSEALWIVFDARGFSLEEEALDFGKRLRTIIEFAGICSRLGIDVGLDRPTAWMSEEFARSAGLIQPHERLLPNIHGLAVVPDDESIRFPLIQADGIVRADPEQFVTALAELAAGLPVHSSTATAGVRLLNLALINSQPLTQIVLALSAVEALGQDEAWTDAQAALIEELATQVETGTGSGDAERSEVAAALRRSLHRIGLRQGVMRVLTRLGLQHLRREWDRIYSLRSGLFHGTVRLTEVETAQLTADAITLTGKIVLTVAKGSGVNLPSISFVHFLND